MRLTGFERRWARCVLSSFGADADEGLQVPHARVDYAGAVEEFCAAAGTRGRLGVRAALWLTQLAPVIVLGRASLFTSLPVAERVDVLQRMLAHPLLLVRGFATLLKLVMSMAIFRDASVRADSHYDASRDVARAQRRALPVVGQVAA